MILHVKCEGSMHFNQFSNDILIPKAETLKLVFVRKSSFNSPIIIIITIYAVSALKLKSRDSTYLKNIYIN